MKEDLLQKPKNSKETPKQIRSRTNLIFFFIGTLNNLCIEITLVYSNDLAKHFHHDNIMTIFHAIMIIFAISTKIINSRYLLKVKHRTKNIIVVLCFTTGVVLLLIAYWKDLFVLVLMTMLFFGIGTSLGEANNLGFMKGFSSDVSAGYTTGTGLSGLIGTTFYLLLKLFHFSFYVVNLTMLIFYPLYVLMFHLACVYKKKNDEINLVDISLTQELNEEVESVNQEEVEQNEAQVNQFLTFDNLKLLWPHCKHLFLSVFLLYLLEYVSNSWLTSHIVKKFTDKYDKDNIPFFITYGFEFASLFYRLFLFFGRASMICIKTSKIKLLLTSLFGFVIFYLVQACTDTFFPMAIMFITLILIAFLGGIIYSNTVRLTLETPDVEKKHKEIALNIFGAFAECGMFVSSMLGLIFLSFLP
jgi:battenin